MKKKNLNKLSENLKDSLFAEKLILAYMKDTGFSRISITEREILAPIRIINSFGKDNPYVKNFSFKNRAPIGKIAILFPSNGINILVAKAVCASFLIGNETIIKFPSKLKYSKPIYEELITKYLANVSFTKTESSKEFLISSLLDEEIKAILIYGDDRWIEQYKDLARRTKTKIIFEGPGNDPQIVFENADIDKAVEDAVECGLMNGGQSCSSMERFFIHEKILNVFTEKLCKKLKNIKLGLPDDIETILPPIKSENIQNRLLEQIEEAKNSGAELLFGGELRRIDNSKDQVMEPTVLINCNPDMSIVKNENFGPVFPIISFNTENELIQMLDDTKYGLNASVYGSCTDMIVEYLELSHRNIYYNSTVTSIENSLSRILDGGFKNSGFVWEWKGENFIHREGRRYLMEELSMNK